MSRLSLPVRIGAGVLVAALCGGCAAPDRWNAFESRVPSGEEAGEDRSVDVPQVLHPEMADIAVVELPDGGKVVELSVEQAVMLAMETNRDLQVRRLGPVVAGTFEDIERGEYDPELFGGEIPESVSNILSVALGMAVRKV